MMTRGHGRTWRVGASAAVVVGLHLICTAGAAAERTPAEATQHAIENLINDCAQGTRDCRTPTATPTMTLVPTATSTLTPQPTGTSEPTVTATPTAEPCWLTDQDTGDPDNGYIVFDDLGAPVPCPIAQVLPADGPPDDGLAVVPDATPVPEVPPPANPRYPNAEPQAPIVIVIIATPAPIPTLPAQVVYESVPGPAPSPLPAEVIYMVVTPTPVLQPTAVATRAPPAIPTDQPALMLAPSVAAAPVAEPEPRIPVNPDHMPPPMLLSFGLLWTRRRVRDQTQPWMATEVEDDDGEGGVTLCLPASSR